MTTTRAFHLGDILSVTTHRMVSPNGMTGIYDILGWMTGEESLQTFQIPRAVRECTGPLLAQHPALAVVAVPDFGPDEQVAERDARAWLAEQVAAYGEFREVAPLAPGQRPRVNPFEEMRAVMPNAEIIVVVDEPGQQP
jgi:hypothetical protein